MRSVNVPAPGPRYWAALVLASVFGALAALWRPRPAMVWLRAA